jgi:hypothetical protein
MGSTRKVDDAGVAVLMADQVDLNAAMVLGPYVGSRCARACTTFNFNPPRQTRTRVVRCQAVRSTSSSRNADFLARSTRACAWAFTFVTAARSLILRPGHAPSAWLAVPSTVSWELAEGEQDVSMAMAQSLAPFTHAAWSVRI